MGSGKKQPENIKNLNGDNAKEQKTVRKNSSLHIKTICTVILASVLSVTLLMNSTIKKTDMEMRKNIGLQARLIADAININRLINLSNAENDFSSPYWARLKNQLATTREITPNCRSIYLLGRSETNRIFFLSGDKPSSYISKNHVEVRPDTDAKIPDIFNTEKEMVLGPYKDPWGTWVTVSAPVFDLNGKARALLCMDIDAGKWKQRTFVAALPVLLLVFFILTAVITWFFFRKYKSHNLKAEQYITPVMIFTLGAAITMFFVWITVKHEQQAKKETYVEIALNRTLIVSKTLKNIRDTELEGLAMFFEHSEFVTLNEFKEYSKHLIKNPVIETWGWVKLVSHGEKKEYEKNTGAVFSTDFRIWEKNDKEEPVSVSDKDVYYPVHYAASFSETLKPYGFDTGSDPVVKKAIEHASETGLETMAEFTFPSDKKKKCVILIRPVYKEGFQQKKPSGFAIAVLDADALLESQTPRPFIHSDIYIIHDDPLKKISLTAPCNIIHSKPGFYLDRPVFAFGHVFIVSTHAERDFLSFFPILSSLTVLSAGFILTLSATLLFTTLLNQRKRLEQMVAVKTEDLSKREEEQRLLTEHALSGVTVHEIIRDEKGNPVNFAFLSVNPAFKIHTGLLPSDVIGRTVTDVFPGIEKLPMFDSYVNMALTGKPVSSEQYSKNLDRYYNISSYLLKDNRFATVFTDISYQKKKEAELEEANERLENILNNIDACVYISDFEKNRLLFINNNTKKLWGDVHGETCFKAIHGRNTPCVSCKSPVLLDENKEPAGIYSWEDKNSITGRWYEVRCYAIKWSDNRMVKMHIAIDITERKKAETELMQSREQFELAVKGSNDGIWDWNLKTNSLYISPKWKEQIGYKDSELPNNLNSFFKSIYPGDVYKFYSHLREHLERKEGRFEHEFRMIHKDGSLRWFLSRGEAVRNPSGKPVRMAGSTTDITARKNAEKELIDANRKLEEAIKKAHEMAFKAEAASIAKSEFLANMSHEIRTPMNGIIGMASLLADTSLDSEQRRYAKTITASGDTLLTLIDSILDFSKIEAGKTALNSVDFNLFELFDIMSAAMTVKARGKGIDFLFKIDSDVPHLLEGDSDRLRQILNNLVGNAIKFTSRGHVEVNVKLKQNKKTDFHTEHEDNVVLEFSVKDTGIGIPKNMHEDIFEKFTQADTTVSKKYGGTGLGLAISKQLVELMGGEISLSSEEGLGSIFYFTVPFRKQRDKHRNSLERVRILVTGGDEKERNNILKRLDLFGARPSGTENGKDALEALDIASQSKDPFFIVITNARLQDMDSENLVRTIKANPSTRETHVVLITSIAETEGEKTFLDMGFSGCLTKPVDKDELKNCIENICKQNTSEAHISISTENHKEKESRISFKNNRGKRILVAEDNLTNQQVVLETLKKLGFSADIAENGKEALKALESEKYDLVLMDCQMPEMNGFEATRSIRKSQAFYSNIPIIALTAYAMQSDRQKCLEAGMNDHIAKPFSAVDLKKVLNTWLNNEKHKTKEKKESADTDVSDNISEDLPVWDRAGMMERMDHDKGMAKKVMEGFLYDIPDQIKALNSTIEKNDLSNLERLAHSLKGAASVVGGCALASAASRMEEAGAGKISDNPSEVMKRIETEFNRLKKVMEAHNDA